MATNREDVVLPGLSYILIGADGKMTCIFIGADGKMTSTRGFFDASLSPGLVNALNGRTARIHCKAACAV